jgi:hypothetical protein
LIFCWKSSCEIFNHNVHGTTIDWYEGEDEFPRAGERIEEGLRSREERNAPHFFAEFFADDGSAIPSLIEEEGEREGSGERIDRWIFRNEKEWLFRAIEEVGELLFGGERHRKKFQNPNFKFQNDTTENSLKARGYGTKIWDGSQIPEKIGDFGFLI